MKNFSFFSSPSNFSYFFIWIFFCVFFSYRYVFHEYLRSLWKRHGNKEKWKIRRRKKNRKQCTWRKKKAVQNASFKHFRKLFNERAFLRFASKLLNYIFDAFFIINIGIIFVKNDRYTTFLHLNIFNTDEIF